MSGAVQAKPNYLEVFHQSHSSIYFPIIGFWTERKLVGAVKQDILVKVEEAKRLPNGSHILRDQLGGEIRDRLQIVNKYREKGQTRGTITIVCGIALFLAANPVASSALAIGGIVIAFFAFVAKINDLDLVLANRTLMTHIADGRSDSMTPIGSLNNMTSNRGKNMIDFTKIAIEMR